MTRLTDDQLATARALEDYETLWLQADPWIKFAMAELRCGDEDAFQEARLAVGSALRSWDPEKGAFSTHVTTAARYAILNHFNTHASGGVGSRRHAAEGHPNKFISLHDPAAPPCGPRKDDEDGDEPTHLDRLTYADVDDSTQFEAFMRSGALQKAADRLLRFIPDEDAEFFRAIARAGGTRAFSRIVGLPYSTVRDRLNKIIEKLSAHVGKITHIRYTPVMQAVSDSPLPQKVTHSMKIRQSDEYDPADDDWDDKLKDRPNWLLAVGGNPWADWAYKPTPEDVANGSVPRDDAFNWSAGARRTYPGIEKRRKG